MTSLVESAITLSPDAAVGSLLLVTQILASLTTPASSCGVQKEVVCGSSCAISLFTDTAILSGYALLRCEIIRNESQAQSDCGSLCSVIARDYCADSLGVLLASS